MKFNVSSTYVSGILLHYSPNLGWVSPMPINAVRFSQWVLNEDSFQLTLIGVGEAHPWCRKYVGTMTIPFYMLQPATYKNIQFSTIFSFFFSCIVCTQKDVYVVFYRKGRI